MEASPTDCGAIQERREAPFGDCAAIENGCLRRVGDCAAIGEVRMVFAVLAIVPICFVLTVALLFAGFID